MAPGVLHAGLAAGFVVVRWGKWTWHRQTSMSRRFRGIYPLGIRTEVPASWERILRSGLGLVPVDRAGVEPAT